LSFDGKLCCSPFVCMLCTCRLECLERLGDEDGIWVWKRINALFNWLPLAALIEGKILCMHGGIGRCINRIEQIAELERPITMEVRALLLTSSPLVGVSLIEVIWRWQALGLRPGFWSCVLQGLSGD
jgi:hypothetical protein